MKPQLTVFLLIAALPAAVHAGPQIIAKKVTASCSPKFHSSSVLNVAVELDTATYGFFMGGQSGAQGLVFQFARTSGNPLVFSMPANMKIPKPPTMRFPITQGAYQLTIYDRLANGSAGPSSSPAYALSVDVCKPPVGKAKVVDLKAVQIKE